MSTQSNLHALADPPKRALVYTLIPCAALLCIASLIAWSAWPVLRPTRSVEITYALHQSEPTSPDVEQTTTNPQSHRSVQAAGWLEAEPYIIAASALTDGVIEELFVLEGDLVKQGDVLATMIDEDAELSLDRAHAELTRSISMRDESQALFVAAQQHWESPYTLENELNSARASLDERKSELDQLPMLINVQESLLHLALEELERVEYSYKDNAASEIEFIRAREHANAQSHRVESLHARKPILQASIDRLHSNLLAAERAFELRIDDRARLESARTILAQNEAEVLHQRVNVREAELKLERMSIRAPISGYVQRRLKSPGDKVVRGMDSPHSAHIAHLYDPEKIQVRVDIPLADASQVFIRQKCEIVVEILPDQTFQGEVIIVTHEADLQKNTLQVKVRVLDPDPKLRPEMLTRVKFKSDQHTQTDSETAHEQRVRVPRESVELNNGIHRVWVIGDRSAGQGVLRPVVIDVTEETDNTNWIIASGDLHPGSIIAQSPTGHREDERVQIVDQRQISIGETP